MIWTKHIFLIGLASLLMVSFLPTLAGRLPFPNLILASAIALVALSRFELALLWAGLGGGLLDLSLPGRPFYTLSLVAATVGSDWLLKRLGGRPSLLLLAGVALITSSLVVAAELLVAGFPPTLLAGASVLVNSGLVLLLFVILSQRSVFMASQRFRPRTLL